MTAGIRIWKETAGETETKQMIPDKLLQEENRVSGEEKRNPSGSPTDSTRKERCGIKRREGTERQEGTEQQDGTWKPESLRQHPAQGAGERSTDRDLQESQELARDFDPAGQDSHPRLVLAVGTAPNKNLRRSAIALQPLPCRLVVLGHLADGDREWLSDLIPGYRNCHDLTEREVFQLYRRVQRSRGILLFPSLYEGFGRPILEAQCMGIPVITSSRNPMQEVAGKGALFVDPLDVREIRDAVRALLKDDVLYWNLQRKGLINAGQYRSAYAAKHYAEIYRELAEGESVMRGRIKKRICIRSRRIRGGGRGRGKGS